MFYEQCLTRYSFHFESSPHVLEMENVHRLEVVDLVNALSSTDVLIIDCRPFIAFNQSSIIDAVNIHCPPILKRRSGGYIALDNVVPCAKKRAQLQNGAFPSVIVYDECTCELTKASNESDILAVIRCLLQHFCHLNVKYISGGFAAVLEDSPALCRQHIPQIARHTRDKCKDRKSTPKQLQPAEILPYLYLGDVCHSSQPQLLQRLGITALLNVSTSTHHRSDDTHSHSHSRYMNLPISDNMQADLLSWFPQLFQFIDTVAAEEGKVLVHCRAGVSRSATVCIAYIMQKQGLSLDAAFEQIMTKRPIIDPNLNFIQQLQKFEVLLQDKCNIPSIELDMLHSPTKIEQSHLNSRPPHHVFTFSAESETLPNIQTFSEDSHTVNTSMFFQTSNPSSYFSYGTAERSEGDRPPKKMRFNTTCSLKYKAKIEPYPSNNLLKRNELAPVTLTHSSELSPSSLSQTAASPNPARLRSRPCSLSFQQRRPNAENKHDITPESLMSPFIPSGPNPPSPAHSLQSSTQTFPQCDSLPPNSSTVPSCSDASLASGAFSSNYNNVPKTPLEKNQTFQAFSFNDWDMSNTPSTLDKEKSFDFLEGNLRKSQTPFLSTK